MLELNQLYTMDCMQGMALFPDKYFDLAIVDPQYGIKEHGGKDRSSTAIQRNGNQVWVKGGNYKKKDWDNCAPGPDYFTELFRVSKNQIIWGVNYYTQSFGPGRIVWDKVNGDSDQSSCEIAYDSHSRRVDLFRYMWAGMMQGKSIAEGHVMQGNKSLNEKRIHPTQKPVALYAWLLLRYAKKGYKILDTHAGSCSSLIACMDLGYDYIGFEKDNEYAAAAAKRIKQHQSQLKLF